MSKNSPTLLTVRDAAERLGVTPRTLKYYEERGLASPTRSEGRYRLYDEDDLKRLGRILRLRSLGFSLQGITEMLKQPLEPVDGGNRYSLDSLQQIHDAIAQQAEALDARIESMRRELKEAQKLRAELSPDLDYLKRRLAGENADTLLEQRRNARAQSAASTSTQVSGRKTTRQSRAAGQTGNTRDASTSAETNSSATDKRISRDPRAARKPRAAKPE